ncbi:hypothetical protein [Streptomyces spinosirectus]
MGYAIASAALLIAGAVCTAVYRARGARGASGLDAEAETHRLLLRLDAGLAPPDAPAGRATRIAQEGLRHVRTAREAMGHGALEDGANPTVGAGRPQGFMGLHSAFPRS